ncbi:MAG: cryptochrome/photolyase family protein, partial [Alphaproteobacteria bacterium HGW-Alphaproteobacteria-16]
MKRGIDTLIPVLGDQLSPDIAALRDADPANSVILMMEVDEEATYVRHHKKKIAFLFAAMRHHARTLEVAGWRVDYVRLDDPDDSGSLTGEVARAMERHAPSRIVATEPGEWRVRQAMELWQDKFDAPVEIREDDRFIAS